MEDKDFGTCCITCEVPRPWGMKGAIVIKLKYKENLDLITDPLRAKGNKRIEIPQIYCNHLITRELLPS